MNSVLQHLEILKLVGGVGALALILLFLAKWFYENLWLKKKALLQTNLAYEQIEFVGDKNSHLKRKLTKRSLKVRRYRHRLEVLAFNPSLNTETIGREIPTIERIFKRKIATLEFKNYGLFNHKEKVVFHFENFPKILTAKDFTGRLEVGSYWLGRNARGEDIIQDKRLPFLFCCGGMGSGKSVALSSYVISLLSSFTENNRPQPKLLLVSSAKQSEFVPLIKRLSQTGEVKTFNTDSLDEIKALNKILDDYIKKAGAFFEVIKKERLLVRHFFDVEHEQRPEPMVVVMDEIPSYFGELLKVKVSKDSSPEEIHLHELNEAKKKLGFITDTLFKQCREVGIFIFLSGQTALSSDLPALSFQNLKQNFILGRGITSQVLSLFGLTELSQRHLEQGCFFCFDGRTQQIIKAPFLTSEDK